MQQRPRLDPTTAKIAQYFKGKTEAERATFLKSINEPIKASSNFPKILLFDIETSPNAGFFFSPWGDTIGDDFILKPWHMICWSAKWLNEDKVFNATCTPEEMERGDDRRITEAFWQSLNDADIVIAHNLNRFDKKVAQTRFLKHRLGLPSHYQKIDTLAVAKKEFKITKNGLDFIGKKFLGVGSKKPTS